MPKTMVDKIWEAHEVRPDLLYIDLHLVHEVTSPQAFAGLRLNGRTVRRPDKTLATADHNVPTDGTPAARLIADELSRKQVETLERNCAEFGVPIYSLGSERQGIVHVIGPELGVTQPGMTIVCGDSHTSTHGAFGALAFGIGTSEVEHVLATQSLPQRRPKTMAIEVSGSLPFGVTAKDLILGVIAGIGVEGGIGHILEYRGAAIEALSMEERMTVCNMSIEGAARVGYVNPDETTFKYLEGRPFAPQGAATVVLVRPLTDLGVGAAAAGVEPVAVLIRGVDLFRIYDYIKVMTEGGPGTATQVFATYAYEVAFNQLRWGRGVTVAVFLVPLLVAGITLVSRHLLRERD